MERSGEIIWRRWPMVPIALACIGGIVLGDLIASSLAWLFPLAFLSSATALLLEKHRLPLLLFATLTVSWANVALHQAVISPHDLRRFAGDQPQLATLSGEVLEPPSTRVSERDGKQLWRTMVVVHVSAIQRHGEWEPAFGKVAVTTAGDFSEELFIGQRVQITGVLQRPPLALAEGLFDYRAHLERLGIYYQLIAERHEDWLFVDAKPTGFASSWSEAFQRWAKATLARGLPVEDEPLRLTWAMMLGWRAALTNDVSEPFMRSGTMHIFAISGLHVALFAAILVNVLRLFQVPRGWCGLLGIPLLWFYTAATGWQASAVRSTIMATVVIAGWSLKRPGDLLNSLAAAAVIILLWEPQQLFMASFQLSFAVVLSIALLLPHFERVRSKLFQPDPMLPPELRPRWQRWLDLPVRYLTLSFATSLAAWLGSLPLVAYYFHLLTPVSLLANLLVVPMSSLSLMSCCGSLFFGAWLPGVAELFNHSAWFWMWLMQYTSEWCAELPGAWVATPAPTAAMFVFYYTALMAVVTGVIFKRQHWKWLAPALAIPAVIVAIQSASEHSFTRLHILGLRGGEALVLDAPGRSGDWLIDCATESDAAMSLTPFLQARGFQRVPNLLLTHGDHRHVSGFPVIEERFQPASIFTSGLTQRSPAYRAIIANLNNTPERWRRIYRSDQAGPWTVLHPMPADRFSQADDAALVLRGEFHGLRVLLMSDLGTAGQRALMERGLDLKTDVLVAGIPTAGEPVTDELLAMIQPQLIIISAGEFPAGERPSQPLRQRLAKLRVPVIYTLDSRSVTLSFHATDCEIRDMDGRVWKLMSRRW